MRGLPTDSEITGLVAVSATDFMWFADAALDVMATIVRELGDDLANRRPQLEGANSPYVILSHCLGVMEYWGGAAVAERTIIRDRDAEFTAHGEVEGLLERTATARQRLEADLVGLDALAIPANVHRSPDDVVPYTETKGSVLLHIIEELFQHLGQMELTRDLLVAGR
jgi:uncharacterized damage-inducible protein DinB